MSLTSEPTHLCLQEPWLKTPGNTITGRLAERKVKTTYDYGSTRAARLEISATQAVWVKAETPQSLLEIDAATGKILNQWMTREGASIS